MKKDPYAVFGVMAMIAVPLAPAFFFGFSFFKSIYDDVFAWTGIPWISLLPALLIGLISAAGLELVGILSGHNAIRFWERNDDVKAITCAVILILYVTLGIVGLEDLLAKGVVMFLVAPLTYLLVGMQNGLDKIELAAVIEKNENKQDAREIKRTKLLYEHEERMARIQVSSEPAVSQHEPALISHVPAVSQHQCQQCERTFGSTSALNAHKRFCAGKASQQVSHTNGVAVAPLLGVQTHE